MLSNSLDVAKYAIKWLFLQREEEEALKLGNLEKRGLS